MIKNKRVLIVDDALDYRVMLSKAFKQSGYKVYLASDGIEAYVKFFKVKPEIMLVDILLPKMRGDTLIKWVKGTELGRDTPIIVISGHTPMKDYVYELGIELFLQKPCSIKDILAAAQEIVEIREEIDELNAKLGKVKHKFDRQHFETEEEKEDLEKGKGRNYRICVRCHRTVPETATRCARCGGTKIESRSE